MKIFLSLFAALLFLFACSKQSRESVNDFWKENGKVKVLSTTAMIHDLVREIGKEHIDPICLIVGEIDPHSYELVKGDDEKISFAQLVVANGLNLEHGASLQYQLKCHPNVVFLGDEIKKKVPDRILYAEGEIDPHTWMDISLWSEGIDSIVTGLSKLDPENSLEYQKNGDLLRQKMLFTHRKIVKELKEVPEDYRYLVTSHDAFHYFAKAYLTEDANWENRCIAPEGLAPEGQLSSFDIQKVINHLHQYQIKVVFPESNISRDALKKIISSCIHSVRICKEPLYGDAMGRAGSNADTYLGMMECNAKTLKREWEQCMR